MAHYFSCLHEWPTADNLASDVRLFADDTSLFTAVYDEIVSAQDLHSDLKTIEEWAYQWKMLRLWRCNLS